MNALLLAHTLVLMLDLVVTALLWVNYRASRQPYLGLATIAGATEIARQVVDTWLILAVDAPLLYHLTSILQFFSTLFFLAALLRLQDAQTRLMPRTAPLALAFVGIYVVQQLLRVTDTALEWYAFFSPLILTYGLILWRAWFVTRLWPLTRISLLVTSLALVILRSWIPAHLSPVPDELSFMLYYLETLVFPLMLGTLNFAAIEGAHLRLRSLLAEREQVARDREEIRKQQAVIDRNRQHTSKLESLGVLAGGIAHDFNNILAGVFGNISLAKEELSAEHPAWQSLEEAEGSMARATHLSSQLFTFAKGGAPMKQPTQLGPHIEHLVRFDLSGSTVRPVIRHNPELWTANVDMGQFQQLFSNLTINARQAMPDGGELHVDLENALIENPTTTGLNPGRYVRVVVRDGGTGIDEKHIEHVFEPYFSTKESGRGLGLATVYSIARRHGGQISVESKLGEGATFTLYLPACEPHSPEAIQHPELSHAPTRDTGGN